MSLFDDHTQCSGAARGVEYAIDTGAGTATLDYQYAQPQGLSSEATGSFRRMPDSSDDIGSGSSVVGWGSPVGFLSGFTEIGAGGTVLADMRFEDGEVIYRALKVDATQVNLSLLRQTAGWTGTTIPPPQAPTPGAGGSASAVSLNNPVVGMAVTSTNWDNSGYWLVASDGGMFSYGDAAVLRVGRRRSAEQTHGGVAATPDGGGYWLVASDGGVFSYGDAQFYGSAGGVRLNKPVVGMAATPDGGGYWLVASDGGMFSYGDAAVLRVDRRRSR